MAFRVSGEEVKEILDTALSADALTPFISAANAWMDGVGMAQKGLSEPLLKEIERWLAAHFACARDPRLASEKIGDATDKYLNPGGGSPYLDYAMKLDASGTLAGSVGKRSVMVDVANALDP